MLDPNFDRLSLNERTRCSSNSVPRRGDGAIRPPPVQPCVDREPPHRGKTVEGIEPGDVIRTVGRILGTRVRIVERDEGSQLDSIAEPPLDLNSERGRLERARLIDVDGRPVPVGGKGVEVILEPCGRCTSDARFGPAESTVVRRRLLNAGIPSVC